MEFSFLVLLEYERFQALDLILFSGEGKETPTLLRPLETANLNELELFLWDPTKYVSPSHHMKTGTDPVSKMLCFLIVFRIPDDEQSPETQWF
jgi:hypothetical protein